MVVWLTQAWAQSVGAPPASESSDGAPCTPGPPSLVVPWYRDEVPPEVRPVVMLDRCGSSEFSLVHGSGEPVAFTVDHLDFPGFVRLVPDAPFAPGEYRLLDHDDLPSDGLPWFTVVEGAD